MALENPRDYRYLKDEYLTFIENDRIRLGINMALGGCVTYLAEKGGKNLINSHDWGRQVQLSFYGYPKPFLPEGVEVSSAWEMLGWNPIGCGDAFGNRSKMLDSRVTEDSIYIKCIPMQWPLNNVPGDCTFEIWYKLNGNQVEVTARLNNDRQDKNCYPACGQELPAVYTNGEWWQVVSYVGNEPYTGGAVTHLYQKNDNCWLPSLYATEHWSAMVDDNGFGLGLWVPCGTSFVSGCFDTPGVGGPKDPSTGYISMQTNDILDADIQYTYEYALIVGTVEEIRAAAMEREKDRTDLFCWHFDGSRDHFWYKGITDAGVPGKDGCLDFAFAAGGVLVSPNQHIPANKTRLVLDAAIEGDVTVKVRRDVYDGIFRLENHGKPGPEETVTVSAGGRLTGEGEHKEHILSLGLPVNSIGFEVEFCGEGHARIWGIRVE